MGFVSLRWRLIGGLLTAWLALAGIWLVTASMAGAVLPPAATDPGNPCPDGAPLQSFAVSLTNVPLFLNRFGDVLPEGRLYVLDDKLNEARITYPNAANPFIPKDVIEPLTLRVRRGDCVEITFTNRLHELPHTALQALPQAELDALLALPNADPEAVDGLVLRRLFPLPGEVLEPAESFPEFEFDPDTAPAASMHFNGLLFDVRGSDGTAAGFNPDSTVPAGSSIVYRLYADQEGEFLFQDGADLTSHATNAGNFIGSNDFGGFGGIMVEPPGTEWRDVNTNEPLMSGPRAIIVNPDGTSFREFALFMHDEIEAEPGFLTRLCAEEEGAPPEPPGSTSCVEPTAEQTAALNEGSLSALGGSDADALADVVDPVTGEVGHAAVKLEWFGFNYRSEPVANREHLGAAYCVSEECSLSSWSYGDPGGGDLVFHSYRNEPLVVRLFHGAEKETHTFHWHIHRWPFDTEDEGGVGAVSDPNRVTGTVSNQLDVQAVSPGSHYTLVPEGGAGSQQGSFGDIIFHCHLYPHFGSGMWGLNRVHDKEEAADPALGTAEAPISRLLPDDEPVLALVPVPDAPAPPAPTLDKPGFPFFMPGRFGMKSPKAPLGVPSRLETGPFPPTELEKNASLEPPARRLPGAFFVNPCPDAAPVEVFDIAVIEVAKVYNDDLAWQNPQQRAYVLQEQKEDVLAGRRKLEPYSPLFNDGDCINDRLTNELPEFFGGTVFDRLERSVEVSIHNHLIIFDVLSSDGTANGWNYDQGAEIPALLGHDDVRLAVGDPDGDLTGRPGFGLPGDETIEYRKYVQTNHIQTNSFHDHMFPVRSQDNGLFGGATIHPTGCTFHDPVTGEPVRVGTLVDVRCPGGSDDYRNFSAFIEDHVPMYQPERLDDPNDDAFVTPLGVPIFPAKFPSSPDDYGVMGVNYSLEPFESRRGGDPADLFSSRVHGDPFTPIPRAYAGDHVKVRLFQLSFEESHGFNLNRWRWKHEPTDPESNVVQAQHLGMLEAFGVEIPPEAEDANPDRVFLRDYLYNYGGAEDWFLGAWGIFRVFGCDVQGTAEGRTTLARLQIPTLQPLPDYAVPRCAGVNRALARTVGNPCPLRFGRIAVPLKRFSVLAMNQDVVYNGAGEHDPNGVVYVLEQDLRAIQSGAKPLEPLVIRANAGDCIEVRLINRLDPLKMRPHCFEALEAGQLGFVEPDPSGPLTLPGCVQTPPDDGAEVPGFQPFPVSARISLNPKLVNYHIGSDGSNVGFNFDSTVAPGHSILYRWYAPDETGIAVLRDLADPHNHLHHGAYGALVIEPRSSTYLDPRTGRPLASGQSAVIKVNGAPDFREYVALMNSDLSLFRPDGMPVADSRDLALEFSDEADDPEDQGEFAIGYRNEPWVHRSAADPDVSRVFSSHVHGDPATPLFEAYSGDNVRFRVAQPQGDPRSTSFTLHGHRWRRSPADPQSQIAALQGQFNPAVAYNIHLDPLVFGGAGGPGGFPGDYLYRSNTLFRHLTGGQWGIFRVHGALRPGLFALPDHPRPMAPPAPSPTPTLSPTPTRTPTPTASPTPTGSATPTPAVAPPAPTSTHPRPRGEEDQDPPAEEDEDPPPVEDND